MRRAVLLLTMLAAALAAGCVGRQGVVPEDVYYRLPDAEPVVELGRALVAGRLGVDLIEAQGLHRERALLYVNADRPYEIRRYHYHHWTQSPGRLVREHLIAYLRAAGAAGEVVRYAPGEEVEAVITGRLSRFERIVDGRPRAAVTIELGYHGSAAGPVRLRREYRVVRPAGGATMAATVEAFGAALDRAYGEFLRDLRAGR